MQRERVPLDTHAPGATWMCVIMYVHSRARVCVPPLLNLMRVAVCEHRQVYVRAVEVAF